ncbi:MAG: LiaF transmembrane domain-containing protein [Christensenellaceae bacterium]|jgi:predicted membrane protein
MKKRNWFWGIFFILATILLIASQVGSFMEISFWSLFWTILLVAVIIQSALHRVWPGIFIPVAVIYMIFQNPMAWPYIAPWILIVAAVFLSIAFYFLFRTRPKKQFYDGGSFHEGSCWNEDASSMHTDDAGSTDDNYPSISVRFGDVSRYLRSSCFTRGKFSVHFGNAEINFAQAEINPQGGEVWLECSFGAIKLYVPRNFDIINKTAGSVGGVEFKGTPVREADSPKLTLSGNISMGGVEVIYI